MDMVRKFMGIRRRPGPDLVSQPNQDDELSLNHLRRLFMEFRHSPTPMTVREQEDALFSMLPLFCNIFTNARTTSLTERFGDVCQFSAHVSQLMGREIRKRHSNRNHDVSSTAVMDFLLLKSSEDRRSGWELLNALNILASGETPVLECMVAANLPSSMVKCLCLFYELPPLDITSGKSIEKQQLDRKHVQELFSQILVKLCHSPATASELMNTDDLCILFSAISCPCSKDNIGWRNCASEVLMTISRYGLSKEVINYIHGKSCIANCLENMRRIQRVNPLELVEMIVALVCCLKDSSSLSHLLLADFSSCGGYLFLHELLLMLAEIEGDEARESCRNIALLVSKLVMIGHVNLRPLVSIGAPFQDPNFEVPEPSGGGVSVKNIEAFHVLQKVFLKTTDKLLSLNILDCISNIYRSDNANYFILEPQHTISLFVDKAPEKTQEVQEKIFELLDFVICNLNWVPCTELMSVSILFNKKGLSDCHQVALSFLIRIVSFNPKYKDLFREIGILEVLTNCLKDFAVILKERDDNLRSSFNDNSTEANTSLEPEEDDSSSAPAPRDYSFLLMGCLRLLLENNPENAKVFRELGGARCAHNMVPYPKSRLDALKIIHELILNGGSDDLGTLLGLMHSTENSAVHIKIEVLNALLKVFELDPKTRAVFREVGGFVYVMSVPLNMEGSLATPASPIWEEVKQEDVLTLLRTVFHVLTAAMQDEPANKNFFMDEVRFRGLADTIRLLGCFSLETQVMGPYTGEPKPALKKLNRMLSASSAHLPLSPTPSNDSVRSSVMYDGPVEPDLSSSPLLYSANEMFKNLFEMATDSFGLKAGNYGPTYAMNGQQVLLIYHSGAITAVVDLLPAICEVVEDDGKPVPSTDNCLELQMYWLSHLQCLLRSEHNQQVMCQAGLPQQLLQRCEAAFVDEDHPLNAPLQRMFERLASQALTPTVLRDFLRLGNPLLCSTLIPPDEEPRPTQEDQQDEPDGPAASITTASETIHTEEKPTEEQKTIRKLSDAITRKISDTSSRGRTDSRSDMGSLEKRTRSLSYRDPMMSMIHPSPDSSFGEESDSDDDRDFELLIGEGEEGKDNESKKDENNSSTESSPGGGQTSPDEDPPPKRPPRKRDHLHHGSPFESSDKVFAGAIPVQSSGSGGKTTVVDGVDVDTDVDSQQEVSTIDQGDDLVIVDVSGNIAQNPSVNTTQINPVQSEEEIDVASQSQGLAIQTNSQSQGLEIQGSGQSQSLTLNDQSQASKDVSQSDDTESLESGSIQGAGLSESFKDSLGKDLGSDLSRRSSQSSITSLENSLDMREGSHKAAEMSVEDIDQQLRLHCAQEPDLQTISDETSQEHSSSESQAADDEPEIPKDKPVPLTRIKCLVSMTTPRDARAHGVSYCPSFVEFDMGVDGFGCLFLPAIAPQALPGFSSVGSVVGSSVVVSAVPGIGTGERLFPPQAGLTFTSWVCVDRFSSPTDDPHPVRLLTVARHFRSGDGKVQMSPCLSLSISPRDKMLVVRTEESAMDDTDESSDQAQREHTEARFLSDLLLEEGRWHHVMVVLNKALIRNSTATLFIDGQHVATSKLKYVQASLVSPDTSTAVIAPYIVAYVGTPPAQRRCSRLLWKLGPTHLIEEPLQQGTATKMFLLGPNYVGSFQSPCFEGESLHSTESLEPLVSGDKVMFGIHAHAQSVLSMAKIRKHFRKLDTRAIAKELGLSTHDNTTPVRLIHNTAAHLPGSSRTIGSVLIGCSGLRTFCPNPVTKLIECIGSVSCLLGLVAMATGVEALYASVKALSCVLRSNPSCRRDMDRTRGYQILALLLRKKKHLLNTHILHLTFALVGTVDSDRESSIIPNIYAFRDLLCDLEVWHDGPGDLERSLYAHFLELLGPGNESQVNADLMQRLGLVPKLLFTLQDETVSDSTAHTIASVLSVLLSNTNEVKNLIRFGQFLASTVSSYHVNENELNLNNDKSHVGSKLDDTDGSMAADNVTPKRIRLRNVLLELILCLIYGDGGSLDHRFSDALQETLGFDWLLLFVHPHIHKTTVVRATRILVTMLGSPAALERFKEGLNNGGWLTGTEMMLIKTPYVVAGFNVGAVSECSENYEICREVCNVPGFTMLSSLLPRHVDVPEIYHLVIALLLGHPVSDVYAGVQFDWHNLYSVFWSSTSTGVKTTPPSPRDPTTHSIYCPDAAIVLLSMARTMVNEEWENTEEGSWLREYPVTLIQFLVFLYRNVAQFGAVCTENKQEFLENLVAILFPKRRRFLRSQEVMSDSEGEGETSTDLVFSKEKTLLITHPAKKYILEFLTLIVTDSLTCTSSNKNLGVIDIILESYPPTSMQPQQAEFQTEVVSAQMDYFLGGNLLANPSAGHGNHAKIVSNAFTFASKVVDKLWIGNFKLSYKVVFNFITSIMEAVKGQSVSLDSIYHSLNRTILYQLSRPLARLTDQTSLLEFLHILTTNHKVIFAPGNNEPEFIAGMCHWLLVMGTQNRRASEPVTSTPVKDMDSAAISQAFGAESAFEAQEYFNEAAEEESSCRRLLEAAAERVWDIFLQNKREAIDDTFKIELPKPSFTSYSPRMPEYMVGGSSNLNLDLKSLRPLIGDAAMRVWVNFVSAEEKHKAEALGQQKPKRRTVARLTSRRTKKDNRDVKGLAKESFLWTPKHIKVVKDMVRLQLKNHQQNYQLISKSIAENWTLMERDLTRERGLWGPPRGSSLDKWTLDLVEGPHRMRKKMCRNELFYVHYPFDFKLEQSQKRTRYKKAISFDSKRYYLLRGPALPGIGPIEALLQNEVSEKLKVTPARSLSEETSYVTETNEGSEVDNQTIVKLLEAGERIRSMYRCARVQGLDTAEGLFLFGQKFFYVVDGVTLLSTKEIKDIDSLPPGTHDPIIPRSSHDITKSFAKERMCSKWTYDDIREVHKRRYLLQQTALEVFSSDGRNHFLVFPKSVRNKVYEKLLTTASTQLVSAEESISGMKRDTDVETGVGIINSLMGERSVTQRWERGEITNFQYLMHLNTLAGRSYNDLMQYPVFPWILADYDSEELDLTDHKTFRDFSKPMGAQGLSRLEHIKKRYREWEDPTGETPPYHYGTHYSSAMIVSSYLIRMEPFSQHFLRLQGGHFDLPDRLFHSIKDSWLSASETNIHDVKELIPEFFYLPEFLTNHNTFDLGTKQSGEPLGDVLLPPWAKGDPKEFIRLHRKALECDYVSARLHEWIDLIFGYRQQGPGAVESFNVFHHLFYEGNVDIHGIDDQVKKSATIGFINNFGQTPKQLFKKPHPPKKVFRAVEPDLQQGATSAVFFHNLPNLVPSVQPVKELKGPVGLIYQSERGLLPAVERNKLLIPPNYNRCIAWGFGDLSMRVGYYETDKGMSVYENFHIGQVLCAACPDSRTLITGGTSSLVCVWDIVKGAGKKPQLILHEVLYGHQSSVTCLAVSTSYQLIVSGSEDQTCIIWDLSKLSYVRQLSDHAAPITAIAINELTGDITTCAGTYLYVWSVNGQLIVKDNTSLQTNNHIQCCAMSELSDWDEENVILTGSLDGVVRMWGIEFYNEAESTKKYRKSVSELSPVKEDAIDSSTDKESHDKSENPTPDPVPDIPEEDLDSAIKESSENDSKPSLDVNDKTDPMPTPEGQEDTDLPSRAPKLSQVKQYSSNLDEEYVIIENAKRKEPRGVQQSKPVWRRRLTLRHKLTMHTSFAREDNVAPAAVTALLISKDHRKLFVGDGRGRIYSWSVTDAAGRMPADHWIKDEGAESCSQCGVRFTFSERRHHCRDCGKLFCAKCSKYESSIQRLRIYKPVRVCKNCFDQLKKEQPKSFIM